MLAVDPFSQINIGAPCVVQYSGEFKLRTHPANRTLMRNDCAGLFRAACAHSTKWLGQAIICIEISSEGRFVRSRAELVVRGRPRNEPINLWGWIGAPGSAPLPRPTIASSPRAPTPLRTAPPPTTRTFLQVWPQLRKHDADWTTGRVVLLKEFFVVMGARCKTQVTNCSRVVKGNRGSPLNWRVNVHYG